MAASDVDPAAVRLGARVQSLADELLLTERCWLAGRLRPLQGRIAALANAKGCHEPGCPVTDCTCATGRAVASVVEDLSELAEAVLRGGPRQASTLMTARLARSGAELPDTELLRPAHCTVVVQRPASARPGRSQGRP